MKPMFLVSGRNAWGDTHCAGHIIADDGQAAIGIFQKTMAENPHVNKDDLAPLKWFARKSKASRANALNPED